MESSLLRVFRRASVRWSTLADTSALAMDERAGQWRKSRVAVAILNTCWSLNQCWRMMFA